MYYELYRELKHKHLTTIALLKIKQANKRDILYCSYLCVTYIAPCDFNQKLAGNFFPDKARCFVIGTLSARIS